MEKKQQELQQLSQSLEDDHSKIEQTHQLIYQIEEQLKSLSLKPNLQLPVAANFDDKNEVDNFNSQNMNFHNDQIASSHPQDEDHFYQQNQPLEAEQENFQSPVASIYRNPQHNSVNYQNEVGKIKKKTQKERIKDTSLSTSPIKEKVQQNMSQKNQKQQSLQYQNVREGDNSFFDLKEIQKEHFSEVALLEQAYRKKLIQLEDSLLVEKNKQEKTISDLHRVVQIMDYQEKQNEEIKRRYQQQLEEMRDLTQKEIRSQQGIYCKRLEACEKEKSSLLQENQELSRAYKIMCGQNAILSSKYNRILSLYSQLIQADQEQLLQNTYNQSKQSQTNLDIQTDNLQLLNDDLMKFKSGIQPFSPTNRNEVWKNIKMETSQTSPYLSHQISKEKEHIPEENNQRQPQIHSEYLKLREENKQNETKRLSAPFFPDYPKEKKSSEQESKALQLSRSGGSLSGIKKSLEEIKATLDGEMKIAGQLNDYNLKEQHQNVGLSSSTSSFKSNGMGKKNKETLSIQREKYLKK